MEVCTAIFPTEVNLMAFPTRLNKIWFSLNGSPLIISGTFISVDISKINPFSFVLGSNVFLNSSSLFLISKSICSKVTLPASILEKSSISLIITRRLSAEYFIDLIFSNMCNCSSSSRSNSVKPIMAFMGVLIS